MMSERPILKLDWCTHKAAKYACENWHYSESIPVGKLVKIGVWEDDKFIGVVIFGRGANRSLLSPYRLKQDEGCELVRIALKEHRNEVTKIVKIAIDLLKKLCNKLLLIISFADDGQGHIGSIYQGGNWIYTGYIKQKSKAIYKGKIAHRRTFDAAGIKGYESMDAHKKYRYLMPLTKEMRDKVIHLKKDYPKRPKQAMDTTSITAAGQYRPGRSINQMETINA